MKICVVSTPAVDVDMKETNHIGLYIISALLSMVEKHRNIWPAVGPVSWAGTGALTIWGGNLPIIFVVPMFLLFVCGASLGECSRVPGSRICSVTIIYMFIGGFTPWCACCDTTYICLSDGQLMTSAAIMAVAHVFRDEVLNVSARYDGTHVQ